MQGVKLCVCPCVCLPVGARVCVCACVRMCSIVYTHNSHCDIEFSTENARTRVWIAEAAAIVCMEKSRERAKNAWAQVFVATAAISTPARSARPAQRKTTRSNLAKHFQHRSAGTVSMGRLAGRGDCASNAGAEACASTQKTSKNVAGAPRYKRSSTLGSALVLKFADHTAWSKQGASNAKRCRHHPKMEQHQVQWLRAMLQYVLSAFDNPQPYQVLRTNLTLTGSSAPFAMHARTKLQQLGTQSSQKNYSANCAWNFVLTNQTLFATQPESICHHRSSSLKSCQIRTQSLV